MNRIFHRPNDRDAAFVAEVAPLYASLPEREPPASLLARIEADRANGDRIILPAAHDVRAYANWRKRTMIAAASLLAASLAVFVLRSGGHDRLADVTSGGSFIRTAQAAEVPARIPHAPALTGIDGRRLHVGHLDFIQQWTDTLGRTTQDARTTFDVTSANVGGQAAWRIVSAVAGNVGAYGERLEVETLFVARSNLAPLRRDVHASPYSRYSRISIAQLFRGDSVVGRMHAEGADATGAGRPISQRLPASRAPYFSEALAPLLLTTVTITPDFWRSISLIGWAVRPNDVFQSLNLRVMGSQAITVPAGVFDCWRMELSFGAQHVTHWVRKSDGLGIRTRDETKHTTLGDREIMLASERAQ